MLTTSDAPTLTTAQQQFIEKFRRPATVRWFFLRYIPSLLWWGVKVDELSAAGARVSIPFGWRTQNPFRSTYFAAQAGAAELSTGLLALLATQQEGQKFSTLITRQEGEFLKKATKRVVFHCDQGPDILAAAARAVATGEPQTIDAVSRGIQEDGVTVSQFKFQWSILAKTAKPG